MIHLHRNIGPTLVLTLLFCLPGTARPESAESGPQSLDLASAVVRFSVQVLGFIQVEGQFEEVQGQLVFGNDCTDSQLSIEIASDSVTTHNETRDELLRSSVFFNTREYPAIHFTSSRLIGNENGLQQLTGKLSLRGMTREVTFTIKPLTDHAGRSDPQRLAYKATTTIRRTDFGIEGFPVGVSDEVSIVVAFADQPV